MESGKYSKTTKEEQNAVPTYVNSVASFCNLNFLFHLKWCRRSTAPELLHHLRWKEKYGKEDLQPRSTYSATRFQPLMHLINRALNRRKIKWLL